MNLSRRVNGNRSETTDGIAFVKEIRADDLTIALSHDAKDREMGYGEISALDGSLQHRESGAEIRGGQLCF